MRLNDGREIFLVQRDYLVMWSVGGLPLHKKICCLFGEAFAKQGIKDG